MGSTNKTKWGSEIWNAKKTSPTNSLFMISSSSTSLLDKNININSSIDSIIEVELNISLYDLAKQEKLLREAMERKQKQDAAIKKFEPTNVNNVVDSSPRNTSTPIQRDRNHTNEKKKELLCDTKSSTFNINLKQVKTDDTSETIPLALNNKNMKKQVMMTKTLSSPQTSSPTNKKSPIENTATSPLQLRWMYQNALNLQASCNSRSGSFRICDGEESSLNLDGDMYPDSLFSEHQQRINFSESLSLHRTSTAPPILA